MSDLVPYQPPIPPAEDMSTIFKIADTLAPTAFVPSVFRNKPAEIAAAILAGRVSFEVLEQSDARVRMRARAPGQDKWTEVDWPISRAQKMGLANKSNWTKMPQSMLVARATSELCRLVAANVLMGLPYSTEEMRDVDADVDAEIIEDKPVTPARARKVRRSAPIQATVQHEEPPLEATPEGWALPDDPEEPDGVIIGRTEAEATPPPVDTDVHLTDMRPDDKISDNTRKAIMAGFNELDIKDRTVRLEKVSIVVGREVPSVNVLTEAEGRAVVDKLNEVRQGWPPVAEPAQ